MVLELTEKEKELLKIALESFESDLRDELAKTDKQNWRYALRGEEQAIRSLIEKVSARA